MTHLKNMKQKVQVMKFTAVQATYQHLDLVMILSFTIILIKITIVTAQQATLILHVQMAMELLVNTISNAKKLKFSKLSE